MILLAMLLLSLGALFLLVAAIGVFRLPDPLQRMHSATKAGTLGATLMLLGVMLSGTLDGMMTGALVILFLLLTLPIGAQLLGRAAYVSGTKLEGLEQDPLEGKLERAEDQPEETA